MDVTHLFRLSRSDWIYTARIHESCLMYVASLLRRFRKLKHRLTQSGHAYRCFCSPDKLAATRERLARTGSNSTYDKTCLHLTEEEAARKVRAGEKHIIRLNVSNPLAFLLSLILTSSASR